MRKLFTLLILIFFLAIPFLATDYYVDATDGNDTNTGLSAEQAWQTLGKVYDEMWNFDPGDNIYFQRGETWSGNDPLSIICSGTSGNPITFGAYGSGDRPAFNGATMTDPPINGRPEIDYITVEDIYIYGYSGTGIFFGDNGWDTNITISRCDVNGGTNGIFIDRTDTYTIEDCTVYNCSNGGIVIYGSPAEQATNGIIRGCTAYDIGQDGIVIHRDGSYNTAGPNHYIYDCLAYNCGEQGFDITAGSNIIVRDCTSHDNATGSIAPGHSVISCYIENFYSYDEDLYSIYIEDINLAVVVKSKVHNPIRTCVDIRDDSDDVYLANNTFVQAAGALREMFGISRETDYPDVIVTRNNIWSESGDSAQVEAIDYYDPCTAANINEDSDYNQYWRIGFSASSVLFEDTPEGQHNLAERIAAYSVDTNSAVGDPLLTDPANGNFALQSGSPAIDAGTWLTAITSANGSGTSFVVGDSNWFHDGFGLAAGSEIQLEGDSSSVTVTDVNYGTHTITVDESVSWTQGDGIAFEYNGISPDIGAVESAFDDQPDFPLIYIDEGCAGTHVGSEANPYDDLSDINWTTGGDNSIYDYLDGTPSQSPTIYLNMGDEWREQLTVGCSGTATYPIVIGAYGSGADPIINGADVEATWTVAYNTSSNLVTDGGLESWSSATDLDDWLEYPDGASTINREDTNQRSGTYGMRADIDASNNAAKIRQNISLTSGVKYKLSVYHYQSGTANASVLLYDPTETDSLTTGGTWTGGVTYMQTGHADSYAEFSVEFTAITTVAHVFDLKNYLAASESCYWDDVTIYAQHANLYQKAVGYDAGVVLEDGIPLNFIAWDTDLATTYATMSQGSFTFDTGGSQIVYVWCTDDADPDTHTMEVAKRTHCITANTKDYITINGLVLEECSTHGIYLVTCDNWTIQNSTIQNLGGIYSGGVYLGNGIEFGGTSNDNLVDTCMVTGIFDSGISPQPAQASATLTNTTIDTCTISECGLAGIEIALLNNSETVSGTAITDTDIYDCGEGWSGDRNAHGIFLYAGGGTTGSVASGTTVTGGSVYSNLGIGINLGKDAGDVTISRTSIYDNSEHGFYAIDSDNPTTTALNLYYCLIYGNTQSGIRWNVANGGGFIWYNNVVYDNGNDGTSHYNVRIEINSAGNELIKNNIFYGTDSYALYDDFGIWAGGGQDYNYFYRASGNLVYFNSTAYTVAQFAAYQAASGQDANSAYADPLMTDPANDDFTLNPHSPCVNAGTDVSLTEDYLGLKIRHAPDIGAYENQTNAIFFPTDIGRMDVSFIGLRQ